MAACQIAPEFLTFAGRAIDEIIDSLEAKGAQTALIAGFEPASDLLGRPAFCKSITDKILYLSERSG
jgi:hypothetical protein